MKPTALVVTTVHWPDDTRIRERLIRTLGRHFEVVYAARHPGPSDLAGLRYIELGGGRFARNLKAIRLALTTNWDVLVVHDPELLVCALLARLVRRRPVVFDVHEDVPASAHTRRWVPRPMRGPMSSALGVLMRLVEPLLTLTLAERGYQRLFARPHVVFPNYPDTSDYPTATGPPGSSVAYLGDVTLERGADLAVAACSALEVPLRLIGRITAETESHLEGISTLGEGLVIEGLVPNRVALRMLAESSAGLAPLRDLPNYRHSQPTKILEYLAVGLPVVASDLPGTRELVEGLDAVFLFEPGNTDALAAAIARSQTREAASLAAEQAPAIRSRFRWPDEEVLDFYRSLV